GARQRRVARDFVVLELPGLPGAASQPEVPSGRGTPAVPQYAERLGAGYSPDHHRDHGELPARRRHHRDSGGAPPLLRRPEHDRQATSVRPVGAPDRGLIPRHQGPGTHASRAPGFSHHDWRKVACLEHLKWWKSGPERNGEPGSRNITSRRKESSWWPTGREQASDTSRTKRLSRKHFASGGSTVPAASWTTNA